jgi:hypothetical protein
LRDSPIGELAMLRRKGTVDDYSKRFMSLSCHDPLLTKPQQIQLYITGLGDPLRTDVALQQPATLDDTVISPGPISRGTCPGRWRRSSRTAYRLALPSASTRHGDTSGG